MLPVASEVSVSLAIPYVVIRSVEDIRSCVGGNNNTYFGWIHAWMYHNFWCYCFVFCL